MAAEAVRQLAARIEAQGKAGDLSEVASLADRLGAEVRRCLAFLPEIQKTTAPAAAELPAQTTS
jgi:hypothetical protein